MQDEGFQTQPSSVSREASGLQSLQIQTSWIRNTKRDLSYLTLVYWRCFDLTTMVLRCTRRQIIFSLLGWTNLYTFSRNEGLSAAAGHTWRRRETTSRWRRRRRLGGFLCAIPRYCQLIWKKKKKKRNSDILGTEVHLHNMSTVILEQAMMHLKALRGVLCEFFYKWSSRDWR